MNCPWCDRDTEVLETRRTKEGTLRRRRRCRTCHEVFWTDETIARKVNLSVLKRTGRRQTFDRNKILKSIRRAYGDDRRPMRESVLHAMVDDITDKLCEAYTEKTEIPTRVIGEKVIEELKEKDLSAWLRYMSIFYHLSALHNEAKTALTKDIEKALARWVKGGDLGDGEPES